MCAKFLLIQKQKDEKWFPARSAEYLEFNYVAKCCWIFQIARKVTSRYSQEKADICFINIFNHEPTPDVSMQGQDRFISILIRCGSASFCRCSSHNIWDFEWRGCEGTELLQMGHAEVVMCKYRLWSRRRCLSAPSLLWLIVNTKVVLR